MAKAKEAQADLETLKASFTQRKESLLLLEPEESSGIFVYQAPSLARWEFLEPEATSVLLSEDEILTWYKSLGTAERLRGEGRSERLLQIIGSAQSLDRLRRYFELSAAFPKAEDQPIRLELSPRSSRVAKRIEDLEIWLDRTHFIPVYVRYVEAGGDTTELRFADLEVDATLAEDTFDLQIPSEVEVREVGSSGQANDRP